jgi:DNA-binding transcriptional MerR regulator
MQVHELATRAGVAPHIVRYYARLALLRPARDASNKYAVVKKEYDRLLPQERPIELPPTTATVRLS